MSDSYLNEERKFWEDNDVGVRKEDFDDEYDYMDAVRERWPDNSEGVDKDDYDTIEEYLEAVREELEDNSFFGDDFDYTPPRTTTSSTPPRTTASNKAYTDAKMEIEMLKIRREMQRKKEEKREVFDTIFPEFRGVPIVWIIIGLVCVLVLLIELIL